LRRLATLLAAAALLGAVAAPSASGEAVNVTPSLVADVDPGDDNAPGFPDDSNPQSLTRVGDLVFFTAADAVHGRELWKTDGTAAGTEMVEDIVADPSGDSPDFLTEAGGLLYFTIDDGVNGKELWTSDGTAAGTDMVEDINPGDDESPGTPDSGTPQALTEVGDELWFRATDGPEPTGSGVEFWKSDGTPGGTDLVEDINPSGDSNPGDWTGAHGTFFFSADDGTNGFEVWTTDGSAANTDLFEDEAGGNFFPSEYTPSGGILYLRGEPGGAGELYKIESLGAGVELVSTGPGAIEPRSLTAYDDIVVFEATDPVVGREPFRSDGTNAGTGPIADLNPAGNSFPLPFTEVNGVLLMNPTVPSIGAELWRTDGTEAGTVLVKDILPQPGASSGVLRPTVIGGDTVVFQANGDPGNSELWHTDGTTANTGPASPEINPGPEFSSPENFVDLNGVALFQAFAPGVGLELWRADISPVPPPAINPPVITPAAPPQAAPKKCRKGQKLKKGKCVKKRRKRKR
jgi:ELWxxDGT repeat protein